MVALEQIVGVNRNSIRSIIVVMFLFVNICVCAQKSKMPCDYLKKIIQSKEFEQYNSYYISERPIAVFDEKVDSFVFKMPNEVFKSDTINLIDLTNTFKGCGTLKWYNYTINITDKNPRNYKPPRYDRNANNMDLVIEKIKKMKRQCIFFFWEPLSNSYIEISISKIKGKYIIKELRTGSY